MASGGNFGNLPVRIKSDKSCAPFLGNGFDVLENDMEALKAGPPDTQTPFVRPCGFFYRGCRGERAELSTTGCFFFLLRCVFLAEDPWAELSTI